MLENNEIVVRSALVPKMVSSGGVSPARAISDFHSGVDATGKKIYTLSVGRLSMLETEDAIHNFGCRVADAANKGKADFLGRELERWLETQHYRGSYFLAVGPVCALTSDLFSLVVRYTPLPNLDEHCDVEMQRTEKDAIKIEVSAARTDVIAALRLLLHDPIEHICPCDADIADHLSPIRLIASNESALDMSPISKSSEIQPNR